MKKNWYWYSVMIVKFRKNVTFLWFLIFLWISNSFVAYLATKVYSFRLCTEYSRMEGGLQKSFLIRLLSGRLTFDSTVMLVFRILHVSHVPFFFLLNL